MAAAPTYWFLLAAENAQFQRFTRGWGLIVVYAIGAYTLVVGLTNPIHRLFVVDVENVVAVFRKSLLNSSTFST